MCMETSALAVDGELSLRQPAVNPSAADADVCSLADATAAVATEALHAARCQLLNCAGQQPAPCERCSFLLMGHATE